MFFKRRGPNKGLQESPQSSTVYVQEPQVAESNLHNAAMWLSPEGQPPAQKFSPQGFCAHPGQGIRSVVGMAVTAGHIYEVTYRAVLKNWDGALPPNFFVGPMFLNAAGQVHTWWREQSPFLVVGEVRSGTIRLVAPEGTMAVHSSVHGSWSPNGEHPNSVVLFTQADLREV